MTTMKTTTSIPETVTGNTAGNGAETAAAVPVTATGTQTAGSVSDQIGGAVWRALNARSGATAASWRGRRA